MGLKKLGIAIAIAIALVLFSASPVMAAPPAVGDISEELICQCGCTLTLNSCTHIECMSRASMTTQIEQRLAKGQSAKQIIQFFVDQYGEQVLSSPPKRGFNLVAWLLPFAAILGGGGVIYMALKKWVRQSRQTSVITKAAEGDEEYQRQLEKELEEFTEKGFR